MDIDTISINGQEYHKSSGGGSGCAVLLVTGLFFLIFIGINIAIDLCNNVVPNQLGKRNGYITTKMDVLEYKNIEELPKGKESGVIHAGTVLKLRKITTKKSVTWIYAWKLKNGVPAETYILIPEQIKNSKLSLNCIEKNKNKYVTYNKKSKTWQAYYDKIDAKNAQIFADCQKQFKANIKNIEIKHSSDNILKESLKKTAFIFPKKGYLKLYKSGENDFYYIALENKKEFINNVHIAEKEYKEKKLEYFPKK